MNISDSQMKEIKKDLLPYAYLCLIGVVCSIVAFFLELMSGGMLFGLIFLSLLPLCARSVATILSIRSK